jgi:hypothetical protein
MDSSTIIQPKVLKIGKLSNFEFMRVFQAILMSILVIFSSGGAQMAYHICEQDGQHWIFENCNESALLNSSDDAKDDCCSKINKSVSMENPLKCADNQNVGEEDCCKDGYFFSLSPYPSVFTKFTLAIPQFQIRPTTSNHFSICVSPDLSRTSQIIHSKPPSRLSDLYLYDIKCVWLI